MLANVLSGVRLLTQLIEQGIKFVTTSSGSPAVCTEAFQAAGITVFHVVPTLAMAMKALDAGVDGLVVEGGEGGHGRPQHGDGTERPSGDGPDPLHPEEFGAGPG